MVGRMVLKRVLMAEFGRARSVLSGVFQRMNDMAAVSVVVPCYRCAVLLSVPLPRLPLKTQRPEEVILVDDASGDETREIMKKLSRQFESGWIKLVFLDENVGAGSARNAGWSIASQPYVAFLDADDAWHFRQN